MLSDPLSSFLLLFHAFASLFILWLLSSHSSCSPILLILSYPCLPFFVLPGPFSFIPRLYHPFLLLHHPSLPFPALSCPQFVILFHFSFLFPFFSKVYVFVCIWVCMYVNVCICMHVYAFKCTFAYGNFMM